MSDLTRCKCSCLVTTVRFYEQIKFLMEFEALKDNIY